jgi:hypothetical protein
MFYRVDYIPAIDDTFVVGLKEAVFVCVGRVYLSEPGRVYKVIGQDVWYGMVL